MQKMVVVIPCYNEEKRLDVSAFLRYANEYQNLFLLFVNDGSSDGTSSILSKMKEENNSINVLELSKNVGKAEAVRQGFLFVEKQYADVSFIAFYDADLATPFTDLVAMLHIASLNDYYLVTGSRIKRMGGNIERKYSRFLLGRIFATFAARVLRLPIYDTQCGAKIFKNEIAKNIFSEGFISKWLFDIELFARIIIQYGFATSLEKIVEYPLTGWKEVQGSKLKLKDIIRQPLNLIKINSHYKLKKHVKSKSN